MNPTKAEPNVNNDVVEKAALLSENIVKILMTAVDDSSAVGTSCVSDLSGAITSSPQRGNLDQYLWKESSRTLPTVASASVEDGATISTKATENAERSPSGFLMQELGSICKKGYCPKSAKALDHPGLFKFCTREQKKYYDNDIIKAVGNRDVDTLRTWHQEGRPLMTSNKFGETILHMACRRGYLEVVAFLVLEARHTLWVHDEQGKTPLHLACHNSKPLFELVDFVIRQDPDLLFIADFRGSMPLDYAPRNTWNDWIVFLQGNEFRSVMPRRPLFFTTPKSGRAHVPTESHAKVVPFLDDIDKIIRDMSGGKKKKKKRRSRHHSGNEAKSLGSPNASISGSASGVDPSSSEDEAPHAVKLKRRITSVIIEKMNSEDGAADAMPSMDMSFLQDLTSLPLEDLLQTLQMQRKLDRKVGASGGYAMVDESEESFIRQDRVREMRRGSDISTKEKRVELLKRLEELQIQHIKAKTSVRIALELDAESAPDSHLAVNKARLECDRLETEIRELEAKLEEKAANSISEDSSSHSPLSMHSEDEVTAAMSEIDDSSSIPDQRRESQGSTSEAPPFTTEASSVGSNETRPTQEAAQETTTDEETNEECMCKKLQQTYGDDVCMDHVSCGHIEMGGCSNNCHLQLALPIPAEPKEDEEELHVEMSCNMRFLRRRTMSPVPESASVGEPSRSTTPQRRPPQRRKSFGGGSLGRFMSRNESS